MPLIKCSAQTMLVTIRSLVYRKIWELYTASSMEAGGRCLPGDGLELVLCRVQRLAGLDENGEH